MNIEQRNKIFEENVRLIDFVLFKYYKNSMSLYEDMYQVGAIALLRAIELYDGSSAKFSTYASNTIRLYVKSFLLNRNKVDKTCDTHDKINDE